MIAGFDDRGCMWVGNGRKTKPLTDGAQYKCGLVNLTVVASWLNEKFYLQANSTRACA